ncbi:unnamed protein product, partial [Mesorhabditis spiculigera]
MARLPHDFWLDAWKYLLQSPACTIADLAKTRVFPAARQLFQLEGLGFEGTDNPDVVKISINHGPGMPIHRNKLPQVLNVLRDYLPQTETVFFRNWKENIRWREVRTWITMMPRLFDITLDHSELTDDIMDVASSSSATQLGFAYCTATNDFKGTEYFKPLRIDIQECSPETMIRIFDRNLNHGSELMDIIVSYTQKPTTAAEFLESMDPEVSNKKRTTWSRLFSRIGRESQITAVIQLQQSVEQHLMVAEVMVQCGILTTRQYFKIINKMLHDGELWCSASYERFNGRVRALMLQNVGRAMRYREQVAQLLPYTDLWRDKLVVPAPVGESQPSALESEDEAEVPRPSKPAVSASM